MQAVLAKRGGLARFPRKVNAFPSKTVKAILVAGISALWSELLFSEDTNTVSKLFCTNLLYVYIYLLSAGVFMSVWEVYRSVIIYQSQVISPGDVPSYISELHIVTTFTLCLSPVSSAYVQV